MKDSTHTQIVDKLMMLSLAVSDMPKAKAFYADTLGLIVTKEYRQDDKNWWVWLGLPEDGVTIILATYHEHIKPGTVGGILCDLGYYCSSRGTQQKGRKSQRYPGRPVRPGVRCKVF